jgi:hypothetical protein
MAISGARAFGFWIDFAEPLPHTGSPTFDASTVWHDGVETVTFEGFKRDEIDSTTGVSITKTIAPGAYMLPVAIKFRPLAGANRDAWNAAVKAGAAVSYKFIEDRNNVASATNLQIVGCFLPTQMLMNATAFGGIVESTITCQPSGAEPHAIVTGGAAVAFGDT